MTFIYYPKCSTCVKAKKWLEDNKIEVELRNIVEDNPSYEELKNWVSNYSVEVNKLFNTSGKIYREKNLKVILKDMELDDKLKLLSENGMLLKRPILISSNEILLGFNQEKWTSVIC